MARQIIAFPQELRPKLPTIVGNVDYLSLQERLQQIDTLLRDSGVAICLKKNVTEINERGLMK